MEIWTPIELKELEVLITEGISKMSDNQKIIWDLISIKPEKWAENEYGQEGNGFWTVAIAGKKVIWYNDIEEGFNISTYYQYGKIDSYGAEQDELQWTIGKITKPQQGA
jgi:hypothetical protein